ncbi:MAG: DNA polymerase III subunit delta [Candidatus Melainabacteria bacterium]
MAAPAHPANISLYYGEEDFLLDSAVNTLRKAVLAPGMESLSHKVLTKPDIHEVIEAIDAVSFNLGGKTLIEIRQWKYLEKATATTAEDTQLDGLKDSLAALGGNPDAPKHVLFVAPKINRSVRFPKWLSSGKVFPIDLKECKPFAFWETDKIVQWLMQETRHRQIQLHPKAALMLVEQVGGNLRQLLNECEKLTIFTAGAPVTEGHVRQLSGHNENLFGLLHDWIRQRNAAERFATLDDILLRQNPVQLFALIQSVVGNLYQIKFWQTQGHHPDQMATALKKHPFKIRKDLEEFAAVPLPRLSELKRQLLALEFQAKTGELPARLALETLLAL